MKAEYSGLRIFRLLKGPETKPEHPEQPVCIYGYLFAAEKEKAFILNKLSEENNLWSKIVRTNQRKESKQVAASLFLFGLCRRLVAETPAKNRGRVRASDDCLV